MVITGVPRKEYWWIWVFFIWVLLAAGPVLNLMSKPVWIGYFPLLYVWSLAMYAFSLVLILIECYKLTFHIVPEHIVSIYDEMGIKPGEDIFKHLQAKKEQV